MSFYDLYPSFGQHICPPIKKGFVEDDPSLIHFQISASCFESTVFRTILHSRKIGAQVVIERDTIISGVYTPGCDRIFYSRSVSVCRITKAITCGQACSNIILHRPLPMHGLLFRTFRLSCCVNNQIKRSVPATLLLIVSNRCLSHQGDITKNQYFCITHTFSSLKNYQDELFFYNTIKPHSSIHSPYYIAHGCLLNVSGRPVFYAGYYVRERTFIGKIKFIIILTSSR